ncbi:MAG TPA: hypothetical protein VGM74_16270, partial [Burkholderiaceae bacterium]
MSLAPPLSPPSGAPEIGWPAGAQGVRRRRRLDRWITAVPAVTATFLSKLSIAPFGAMGLSLAVPMLCATGALGLLLGRMVADVRRLLAFIALLALLWGMQVLRNEVFSVSSLMLFTLLHFPYVLRMRRTPDYRHVLAFFQGVAVTIAVLGLVQYAMQFLVGPTLAFPIENFFPEAFKVSKFNMQGYLEYGSEVYRTNGVFMLEPSFFSQLLAVAVVLEAVTRRRPWVLVVLLAAMAVSYSGTGLMLLGACLPCLAVARRRWDWLLAGALLIALALLGAETIDNPYVNVFLKRAGEFTEPGSSGFERFVGGFYVFGQLLWPQPWRGLFGFGAGALQLYETKAYWPFGSNAVFKMVFEFGLVGGLAYF